MKRCVQCAGTGKREFDDGMGGRVIVPCSSCQQPPYIPPPPVEKTKEPEQVKQRLPRRGKKPPTRPPKWKRGLFFIALSLLLLGVVTTSHRTDVILWSLVGEFTCAYLAEKAIFRR